MDMGVFLCKCMAHICRYLWRPQSTIRFLGSVTTGSCELPDLPAGSELRSFGRAAYL